MELGKQKRGTRLFLLSWGGERVLAGRITSLPAGNSPHCAPASKEGNRYGNWAIQAYITSGHTLGTDLDFTVKSLVSGSRDLGEGDHEHCSTPSGAASPTNFKHTPGNLNPTSQLQN